MQTSKVCKVRCTTRGTPRGVTDGALVPRAVTVRTAGILHGGQDEDRAMLTGFEFEALESWVGTTQTYKPISVGPEPWVTPSPQDKWPELLSRSSTFRDSSVLRLLHPHRHPSVPARPGTLQ